MKISVERVLNNCQWLMREEREVESWESEEDGRRETEDGSDLVISY